MKFDKKVLISIMLGIVISVMTNVIAESFEKDSKNVYYKDNSSLLADNVQDAIDGTCLKFDNNLSNLKNELLKEMYPIGSIYISTTMSTVAQVKAALGGEWEAYGNGRTLLSSTGESGKTGGSTTTTLTIDNLPEHTHDISHTHTTSQTDTSIMSLTAELAGKHNHTYKFEYHTKLAFTLPDSSTAYPLSLASPDLSTSDAGEHTHNVTGTVTVPSLSTNSISTTSSGPVGKGTAINVQNPYITVYMYKRIN